MLESGHEPDLPEVRAVHPYGDDLDCLLERNAELLVCDHPSELGPRRLRRIVHHYRERTDEAVSSAKSRRQNLEVVRQLLREELPLAVQPAPDDSTHDEWNAKAQEAGKHSSQEGAH